MNGFKRRARRAHRRRPCRMAPSALIVEIAGRADVRDDLARRVVDDEDGGRQLLARASFVCSSASVSSAVCTARSSVRRCTILVGAARHLGLGQMRGELREMRGVRRGHGLELGARRLRLGDHAGRDGACEHAVAGEHARPAGCDRGGAPRATAAAPPAVRPRRRTAAAAPCRNRRERPRARPRCCRRRAQGCRYRAQDLAASRDGARAAARRTIWRSLARPERS